MDDCIEFFPKRFVIEDDIGIVELDVVRHDPLRLARVILGLVEEV